jgi:hypothetical protein
MEPPLLNAEDLRVDMADRLDQVQIDTCTTLAFFFNFSDTRKQKLEDLLRSLAVQLYYTENEAARRLNSLFTSYNNRRRQPDITALLAFINIIV